MWMRLAESGSGLKQGKSFDAVGAVTAMNSLNQARNTYLRTVIGYNRGTFCGVVAEAGEGRVRHAGGGGWQSRFDEQVVVLSGVTTPSGARLPDCHCVREWRTRCPHPPLTKSPTGPGSNCTQPWASHPLMHSQAQRLSVKVPVAPHPHQPPDVAVGAMPFRKGWPKIRSDFLRI
jgi:hypothetical protein